MKYKLLAVLTAVFSLHGVAAYADYPEKPIEIVVPFAAGGGTDVMARIFGSALGKELDVPVVIKNTTGAGGEIGMTEVGNGPADGYKLLIINTPNVLAIPLERSAGFSVDSFELLGSIADDPATLSVRESGPIDTIEDLVAAAKDAPGALTYGSSGVGSSGHIAMLLLEQSAGIKAINVPYDGTSAVRTALLNSDVKIATANLGEALSFMDGTDWKILGVMASERVATQPDLPTFTEAGFPITGGSLRGLGVAKGTPAEIVEKLRSAMADVMKSPAFLEASAKANVPIRYLDAKSYAAELGNSAEALKALWEKSPWK
jgi:tripartite-type tricarboxylate transporter receptor subunit TctC